MSSLSRYDWLQPEEPYWHSDVPAGVSSETNGQNKNHRNNWLWEAACWSERHRGRDELQRLRHWGRSRPQQSLAWQRWGVKESKLLVSQNFTVMNKILLYILLKVETTCSGFPRHLQSLVSVSLQDLAGALFIRTPSARCGATPTRLLIRWWGRCLMLLHESPSGGTAS